MVDFKKLTLKRQIVRRLNESGTTLHKHMLGWHSDNGHSIEQIKEALNELVIERKIIRELSTIDCWHYRIPQ